MLNRRLFLGLCALPLADVLRLRAESASRHKSVIFVYLNGGPSHMDMYDLKPDAPVEYRGEFKPIDTNVPGIRISEHLPLHAKIADKFAIIRNMKFQQEGHTAPELYTGFLRGSRPAIGSVVSKLRADQSVRTPLPPYVYLGDANHVGHPGFLGKAHEAYIPGEKAANLGLSKSLTLDKLADRRTLLSTFDDANRSLDDPKGSRAGMDAFSAQALEMMTTNAARDAFDLTKESPKVRENYGKGTEYLLARRLVEAGVPVVSITPQNHAVARLDGGEPRRRGMVAQTRTGRILRTQGLGLESGRGVSAGRRLGDRWCGTIHSMVTAIQNTAGDQSRSVVTDFLGVGREAYESRSRVGSGVAGCTTAIEFRRHTESRHRAATLAEGRIEHGVRGQGPMRSG